MQTLDLRKTLKHLYNPSPKQPTIVDVPAFQFAMVDGAIEPGMDPEFVAVVRSCARSTVWHLVYAQVHGKATCTRPYRLRGDAAGGALVDRSRGIRLPAEGQLVLAGHDHAARPCDVGSIRRGVG